MENDLAEVTFGPSSRISAAGSRGPLWRFAHSTRRLRAALVQERLLAMFASAFELFALILACVGRMACSPGDSNPDVADELGLRMALGAQRREIVWLVLKGALRFDRHRCRLCGHCRLRWAGSRLLLIDVVRLECETRRPHGC